MRQAPGLRRLQAVGDHIHAFDVQVASPEEVADEVLRQNPVVDPTLDPYVHAFLRAGRDAEAGR